MTEPSDNPLMRDTENGLLPPEWGLVKLGEVSLESIDRNRSLEYSRDDVLTVDNELGLVPSDRKLGEDFSRYKLVRRGQFAYNPMRLNVGSIGLWREKATGIVSPDYIVFGCIAERLHPDFLDLFRDTAAWEGQIRQSGQGSVRIRYYYRHIAEFTVPLPPLAEQRAIAHVLRTVQQAEDATAKVVAAARELKQSLMRHLFTYGPVPFEQADQVTLGDTEAGSYPADWQVVRLGDLIEDGPQNGLYKHASFYGDGTPILRIDTFSDGDLIASQPLKRLQLTADEVSLYSLREGDIVVNRVNGSIDILAKCGLVGRLDEPTVFESNMMRFSVNPKWATPRFVTYYFLSPFAKAQIKKKARVIHQASVNQQDIKSMVVALPPLKEQDRMCWVFERVEEKLRSEQKRAAALDLLFRSLLHNLMTGKVRVHDLPALSFAGDAHVPRQ